MFKNTYLKTLIASLFLSFTALAFAQDEQQEGAFFPSWEFGGTVGVLNLDSASANREFIDSEAYVFGGFAEYVMESWLISLGMDFIVYDDNAEFTQRTEDFFGDEEDTSSDANGFILFGAVGPKWQFGETLLTVQGGYAQMFASERGISNCSDCFSEDIEIDAGAFGRATIRQNAGPVAIGLSYTQFIGSDDIDNKITFSVSTSY